MTKKGWNNRTGEAKPIRGKGFTRVKTARNRTNSSARWLQRQLNDPYVAAAREMGYRSRAAFKLKELDEKYDLLRGCKRVVDLGCAPGGWTQIITEQLGGKAQIIGIDLQEVEPVAGAKLWVKDFLDEDAESELMDALDGPADIVVSDMANSSTGHKQTDHLRTMSLCEAALDFAIKVLKTDGKFVAKVLQGGSDHELVKRLQQNFTKVKHAKPPSSRKDSTEWFVVATGFKGRKDD